MPASGRDCTKPPSTGASAQAASSSTPSSTTGVVVRVATASGRGAASGSIGGRCAAAAGRAACHEEGEGQWKGGAGRRHGQGGRGEVRPGNVRVRARGAAAAADVFGPGRPAALSGNSPPRLRDFPPDSSGFRPLSRGWSEVDTFTVPGWVRPRSGSTSLVPAGRMPMSTAVQGLAGLDAETLGMILDSIREFCRAAPPAGAAARPGPLARLPRGHRPGHVRGAGRAAPLHPRGVRRDGRGRLRRLPGVRADGRRSTWRSPPAVLATFLGSDPILFGGTEEQKARWLGRIAEEGLLMAYGATEPEAGSDLGALRTTATPVVEDGARDRATGSTAPRCGSATAATPTSTACWRWRPADRPGSCVEKGTEGFAHGKPEDKHGIRASNTAALSLRGRLRPARAWWAASRGRGWCRRSSSSATPGSWWRPSGWAPGGRRSTAPSATRRRASRAAAPLSEKQGYTHKLIVPHACRLEAGAGLHRGDGHAHRRRRGHAQHRGRHRQVPRHRGGQRRRRRGHPGARRLRLHARVHGREDQAGRAHHHDLRGHLGDHGDDHRARPLAGAPEDARPALPRRGRGAGARCTPPAPTVGADVAALAAHAPGRAAGAGARRSG